jgi:hypothetical protein
VNRPAGRYPAAQHRTRSVAVHRVPLAAAFLDHTDRSRVVSVAGRQSPLDSKAANLDQRLTEHLGGVHATTFRREDPVSDVATHTKQPFVELVSDRDPADDAPIYLGDENVLATQPSGRPAPNLCSSRSSRYAAKSCPH